MAAVPHQQDDVPIDDEILKRTRFIEAGELADADLKELYSQFGYVYIKKIINNTNKRVLFENPYNGLSGDIKPGESEENKCKGYLPYWSHAKRYEISYVNENLHKRIKLLIKDQEGSWLVSFAQEGVAEDTRAIAPESSKKCSEFILTINTNGYSIFETTGECRKGGKVEELIG